MLWVEEPDGEGLGVVTSVAELDEIMQRLNRRGHRESRLLTALYNVQDRIAAATRMLEEHPEEARYLLLSDPQQQAAALPPPPAAPLPQRLAAGIAYPSRQAADGYPVVIMPMAPTSQQVCVGGEAGGG